MKHLLSILLLICLHMPCATSEASREPILFRDIPWGISITEATTILQEQGFPDLGIIDSTKIPQETTCFFEDHAVQGGSFWICYNTIDYQGGPVITAGGYEIQFTNLYAVPGIQTDGTISTSFENSHIYRCQYNFGHWKDDEKEEAQAVFDDLARKLSVLYGEGLYETDRKEFGNDSYWLIDDTVTWFGSDHTAVVLTHSYISDDITIDYWDTGCCEEFQAVINVQTGEYNAALDTSGL